MTNEMKNIMNHIDIIKDVMENISNSLYHTNVVATAQLIDLINELYMRGLYPFNTPHMYNPSSDKYVQIYDECGYTYTNWEDLVRSEKEQGEDGFTRKDCFDQIGETIWQLPCGWYVQFV